MSFGGSGNEGNSRNATNTTTTTNNTDNRIVADNGAQVVSGTGNTVNMLDGGAIDKAFEFANNTSAIAGENYSELLTTTSSALSGILNGIASTQNFIAGTQAEARGSLDSKTLTVLGLAGLGVFGFIMMRKK